MRLRSYVFIFVLLVCSSCSIERFYGLPSKIKLVEINSMHFINITLNGKKAKLLIDTGASKSLLDISKEEEFGFNSMLWRSNYYIGLGGKKEIYILSDYKVNELFIPFLGTDLSELDEYFGRKVVGVLGSDFLKMYRVSIDFEKNIMYLSN